MTDYSAWGERELIAELERRDAVAAAKAPIDAITIRVYASSNEDGYMYDLYKADAVDDEKFVDSYDGGLCTGSMLDALGMAVHQAETIIRFASKAS